MRQSNTNTAQPLLSQPLLWLVPVDGANQSNSATISSTSESSNNTSTAEAEGDAVSEQEVESSSSVRLFQSNERVRGTDNN